MKNKSLLLSILSLMILSGCQGKSSNSESSNVSSTSTYLTAVEYSDETDLLISEYVEGTGMDKAIEIYNIQIEHSFHNPSF